MAMATTTTTTKTTMAGGWGVCLLHAPAFLAVAQDHIDSNLFNAEFFKPERKIRKRKQQFTIRPAVWNTNATDTGATCNKLEDTRYNGLLLRSSIESGWERCCEACRSFKSAKGVPCNTWEYCEDKNFCSKDEHQRCVLKYDEYSRPQLGPRPGVRAHDFEQYPGWTAGSADYSWRRKDRTRPSGRKYHVIITSDDSFYQMWQCRLFYYHYQRVTTEDPGSDMGGFTRILHTENMDALGEEMHTVRIDPLEGDMSKYPVLTRPWAFHNFIKQGYLDMIEEDYIMMAEPDHILLRAVPNLIPDGFHGIAFPFHYILPLEDVNPELIDRVLGRDLDMDDLESITGTGSSPVIIHKDEFRKVTERWHNMTLQINEDTQTKKKWGWVLEMWSFSLTAFDVGVRLVLDPLFMAEPPYSTDDIGYAIIHLTYGMDTDLEGNLMLNGTKGPWRFDKRSFRDEPPANLKPPPDGAPELIKMVISKVNEAARNSPKWFDNSAVYDDDARRHRRRRHRRRR